MLLIEILDLEGLSECIMFIKEDGLKRLVLRMLMCFIINIARPRDLRRIKAEGSCEVMGGMICLTLMIYINLSSFM